LSTTDARLICLATTVVKFIPQIYCRHDVTFSSTHPPHHVSMGPTLERDVFMQWPMAIDVCVVGVMSAYIGLIRGFRRIILLLN